MILAEMTSPEVDALPRDIVVLMPVASCEQHSLHLPVFTDSLIGQEVARRVHERCPDDVLGFTDAVARILSAPYTVSRHHQCHIRNPPATNDGHRCLYGRTRFQEDSHPEQSWRKWCPYLRPAPTFDGALRR